MLQTLSIKQFAIIEELEIQFSDGLTVLVVKRVQVSQLL